MATFIEISDELLEQLKQDALRAGVSLSDTIDTAIRRGLEQPKNAQPAKPFRQKTYSLGKPKMDLTKALAISFMEGDEKIIAMMRGVPVEPESECKPPEEG